MNKKYLIVIVGPTAVGKSALAVEIASLLNGEIISADSMQIYKNMDIGTAKLSENDMIASNGKKIKHHLIDIIQPTENFSVSDYQKLARNKIEEVIARDKLPFLVGGTGLYINAVIDNYIFEDIPVNENLRVELKEKAALKGNNFLHNELEKIDPVSAKKIHPNNLKRIIRALEYYYTTGKTISQKKLDLQDCHYDAIMYGLYSERSLLYNKINKRVEIMLQKNLIDEVKSLLEKGVTESHTAMQGLGYKEIVQYLSGRITYEEAVRRIKRDTRHFAKRQLTWFRRDKRIKWLEISEDTDIKMLAQKIKSDICRIINMKC